MIIHGDRCTTVISDIYLSFKHFDKVLHFSYWAFYSLLHSADLYKLLKLCLNICNLYFNGRLFNWQPYHFFYFYTQFLSHSDTVSFSSFGIAVSVHLALQFQRSWLMKVGHLAKMLLVCWIEIKTARLCLMVQKITNLKELQKYMYIF